MFAVSKHLWLDVFENLLDNLAFSTLLLVVGAGNPVLGDVLYIVDIAHQFGLLGVLCEELVDVSCSNLGDDVDYLVGVAEIVITVP